MEHDGTRPDDGLGRAGRAAVAGARQCELGERLLTDSLAGAAPEAPDGLERVVRFALLDNVRELRASLARLGAVLGRER